MPPTVITRQDHSVGHVLLAGCLLALAAALSSAGGAVTASKTLKEQGSLGSESDGIQTAHIGFGVAMAILLAAAGVILFVLSVRSHFSGGLFDRSPLHVASK